ncbi:MAG: c-type cytochrome [Pseudomonadota bacterium]
MRSAIASPIILLTRWLVTGALLLPLSACAAEPTARASTGQAPIADAAADAALSKRGRILFLQCRSCHSLNAGGEHKVGPNLHGLFGATAASKPGFGYSEALQRSGITWNAAQLERFLESPNALVAGTAMAFVGLPAPEDRRALIAYLKEQTR